MNKLFNAYKCRFRVARPRLNSPRATECQVTVLPGNSSCEFTCAREGAVTFYCQAGPEMPPVAGSRETSRSIRDARRPPESDDSAGFQEISFYLPFRTRHALSFYGTRVTFGETRILSYWVMRSSGSVWFQACAVCNV